MSLSFQRLQELLGADAKERRQREQEAAAHQARTRSLRKAIDDIWQAHGVILSEDGTPPTHYERPIPDTLFQTPLSELQTTLVQYSSLPRPVQSRLSLDLPPDSDELVEIPLAYLEREQDVQTSGDLATNILLENRRRRLGGNLTNKLSEYTRGAAGQSRPLRPGGLGSSQLQDREDDVDVYRTPEAIARSMKVLEQGSEASWKDGTLITAPPGVDFQAGLTWNRLYGDGDDVPSEDDDGETRHAKESNEPDRVLDDRRHEPSRRPDTSGRAPQVSLFRRAFFDDDSLFESSSDDEGGSSDEDGDGADCSERPTDLDSEHSGGGHDNQGQISGDQEVSTGVEEVDDLLAELTLTDDAIYKRKKLNPSFDPIALSEMHARDETDSTRKTWASTKLLPIHDFGALIPNPAMVFPFTLDDFQQQAVARLERSESVFVAAHTSAGKTVVAEYAVALAKQRATRCVYTSPIKALSNQKFRDFCLKFGADSIGLVTGDLQLNVDDSTCLIMTTEILRSMLYRGADLVRDIEFVIFDEVHYINDTERGVVWEEVIIMLPSYVNLIFLSATTPNTIEFSDWIGRTKRKVVHVVKTDYRPVPLSHHLWAGTKLHRIMQGKGSFLESGYRSAVDALIPASAKDPKKQGGKAKQSSRPATGSKHLAWQAQGSKQNWMSLIRFLDHELLVPTVVFSFSKKKCEEIAYMLRSLDLNTAKERGAVQAFTIQTVARLSQNDAKLPQVLTVCEMVQRGIGVHHGGLLPILKEMVEILFSKNLIKVLFATETFAMGVNMPARCVVFNSIRKHDGNQFRVLEPGEYTQMAGRAGRRGLDEVGTVILCCFGETPPPQPVLKQLLTGTSTRLESQFRLTYNMILNLLRVEEMSVESMISRSFSEFATQRALTANEFPQLLEKGVRTLEKLERKFVDGAHSRVGLEDLEDFYETHRDLSGNIQEVVSYIKDTEPGAIGDLLPVGRLLLVTAPRYGYVRAPAVVVRVDSSSPSVASPPSGDSSGTNLVCLVLLPRGFVAENDANNKTAKTVGYVGSSRQRFYTIQNVSIDHIQVIASTKRKLDQKSLLSEEAGDRNRRAGTTFSSRGSGDPFSGVRALGRKSDDGGLTKPNAGSAKGGQVLEQTIAWLLEMESLELHGSGISSLDLHNYVKRGSDVVYFRKSCDAIDFFTSRMREFSSYRHPNLEVYYTELARKETLREKVDTLRHLLSNESLQLFPDFLQRKAVLHKLGYIDNNETVAVKGRVACEVNTCEELIATEIVFEGLLNDLSPEEIVAALSALIFQERRDEDLDAELPGKLVETCEQMKRIALNLGRLQKEHGLDVDPREYADEKLKFGLVHVVYEWALGVPFKSICDLTDVQEGSIVRCIARLDELCREIRNCARVVGNPTLYQKLEAASTAIKRDIVFASSLYVS